MNDKPPPLKLFISYSHNDKTYLDELLTHISTIKRNGLIGEWTDNKLVVGDKLDPEIKKNLLNSKLIAFLVSANFLKSWYCYEVELKETLDRLKNNECRIIPIIIKPCDWQDSELGEYLAAPKDGKPVSTYGNQRDSAWIQVINSIKDSVKKINSSFEKTTDSNFLFNKFTLNSDFANKLNDTEVIFQNRKKEKVYLDDIFVFPDLKKIKKNIEVIDRKINSKTLDKVENLPNKVLIMGEEQSGKTSLAKIFFKSYFNDNCLPLFCNGIKISSQKPEDLISKLISEQYSNQTYKDFISENCKIILIVDDYDQIKLNIRAQKKFLDNVLSLVDHLVLFSHTSIMYMETKFIELADFEQYEIFPFGNSRRCELIEKWVSMGEEDTIDVVTIHNETDTVMCHVDAIIRENIVPPKPIYVLSIIQLLDTTTPSDYSLTSYGHCYQNLIQGALSKAKINASDFDGYLNYSTQLAYFIFLTGSESINEKQLDQFKKEYSKSFVLESHEKIIKVLITSGIIKEKDGDYSFNYRYIFYFYVAKHIADHLNNESYKKIVEDLCNNLHTEKNANILIFLVHHSKNQYVTDEILLTALTIFDGTDPITLDISDTDYLYDYMDTIPSLVIDQKNVDEERKKRLKTKDEIQDEIEDTEEELEILTPEDENKIYREINRSVRIVEIIGQILRNRYGSLTKQDLKDLTLSAYSSGLKFLNFFLSATKDDKDQLINFIGSLIKVKSDLSSKDIAKIAKNIFVMLCYGTSFSVIRKIGNSIGTEKLLEVFEEISEENKNSPAHRLVEIAIHLEFTKDIPRKLLDKLYSDLEGNPIGRRLLQELVIQHSYLNQIEYKDKQWINEKLGIHIRPSNRNLNN